MGPEVTRCPHCFITTTAWDHSACAFISDLAAMRGISFAEAGRQYNEANFIDAAEAQMTGGEALEPAPAMAMFTTDEEARALGREHEDAEIAPALLDRLGFKRWFRR